MSKKCQAKYLEDLINNTSNGEECVIPNGEYYIEKNIIIRNKKNLKIRGSGSTIISHFNNGSSNIETCDIFYIFNCLNVELSEFIFTTDYPVNLTGIVKSVNKDDSSYELEILHKYNVTGKEIFMMQNSCDDEGCFDNLDYYHTHPDKNKITLLAGEILLATSHSSCDYEYLGDWCYKVFLPNNLLDTINVGKKICVRHSSYGPIAILIKNSKNTTIRNVNINSTGGMGIIVLPRSENLYLDSFNMYSIDPDQLMSGNCDAIHITGLKGELVVKNCVFDGLGDDALNIHSIAATVTDVDYASKTLKCNYCKKTDDGILSPDWCSENDKIIVLDKSTCKEKGSFRVLDFSVENIIYDDLVGDISEGDILQNTSFSASVLMKDCDIKRTRARACVLQTENIEISNCNFYGMSLAAIKAAPDIVKWYEVGPVKNMLINNNVFEKCGFARKEENEPIIAVQDNHDKLSVGEPNVHSNIKISNNTFKNKLGRCIFLSSTDNVKIFNNEFENCIHKDSFEIVDLSNCENIKYDNE